MCYAGAINSACVSRAIHESETKLAGYRDYPWFQSIPRAFWSSSSCDVEEPYRGASTQPSITPACLGNFPFSSLPSRSFAFSPKIPGTEIWLRCSQGCLSLVYLSSDANDARVFLPRDYSVNIFSRETVPMVMNIFGFRWEKEFLGFWDKNSDLNKGKKVCCLIWLVLTS